MIIEIRSQVKNNLIHQLSKGLEILPRNHEVIIIESKKYIVVTLDHYLNENKIVIRVTKF